MTRSTVTKRLDFDLKIKRTIHNLRKNKQEQKVKIKEPENNSNPNAVEITN